MPVRISQIACFLHEVIGSSLLEDGHSLDFSARLKVPTKYASCVSEKFNDAYLDYFLRIEAENYVS